MSRDAQLATVPESTPEVVSTGSGPSAGDLRELSERGVNMPNVSSAPSIADIHPLPCSNPPYNPDFEKDSSETWSSTQPRSRDAPLAGERRTLSPPETRGGQQQQQQQRTRQLEEVSATTGNRLALSFLVSNSQHRYPPEQPPKYEDIIRESDAIPPPASAPPEVAAAAAGASGQTPTTSSAAAAATAPPTSSSDSSGAATAMKLVRSFGKYGEISTQPGAFRAPGRLSVAAKDTTERRVVVGDGANGTVQVFAESGECLSMLRADGVRGCCLLDDNHRLLIALDRAVEVSRNAHA